MNQLTIVCIDHQLILPNTLREQLPALDGTGVAAALVLRWATGEDEAFAWLDPLTEPDGEVPVLLYNPAVLAGEGDRFLRQWHHRYPNTLIIVLTTSDPTHSSNHWGEQVVEDVPIYRTIRCPWEVSDLQFTVREAVRHYVQTQQLQCYRQQLDAVQYTLQREMVERQQSEAHLSYLALHDALTGLPNRQCFIQQVNALLQRDVCNEIHFAVLFIDLDRFKRVNDSLGHMVGDQFLKAIAHRLQQCVRGMDTVARLGGDEFTVLLNGIATVNDAIEVAERILTTLSHPFRLEGHQFVSSASIGIVASSDGYVNAIDLLRDADTAMYQAKANGKSQYVVFQSDMYIQTLNSVQLESELRMALDQHQLLLHYQPIVSLTTGHLTGFEALTRWYHPRRGIISPEQFIPLAEESDLILTLNEWVLREACRQLNTWQLRLPHCHGLTMSVNLSGKQLKHPHLVETIDRILAETELSGRSLTLEVTERMLSDDPERVIDILRQLRDRQITLSIDDFGTGYSSLSCLHRFPVNALKIDRLFVSQLEANPENFEIVRVISTLARTLGLHVIAEGIETLQQAMNLKRLGCEYGQGHYFYAPLAGDLLEQQLTERNCSHSAA